MRKASFLLWLVLFTTTKCRALDFENEELSWRQQEQQSVPPAVADATATAAAADSVINDYTTNDLTVPPGVTVPPDAGAVLDNIASSAPDVLNPTDVVSAWNQGSLEDQQGAEKELQGLANQYNLTNLDTGEFSLPDTYQAIDTDGRPNCGVAINATREVCDRLISGVGGGVPSSDGTTYTNATASGGSGICDCYSFCGESLSACYDFGAPTPLFDCNISDMIVGCQENFTARNYTALASAPNPCPLGHMCSRDSMQSCEIIRAIPLVAKLGDIHAGMYCP